MEVGKIEQLANHQMPKGDRVQDVREPRSRSEYTLLWELVQRNPAKALEYVKRIASSRKGIDQPLDGVVS